MLAFEPYDSAVYQLHRRPMIFLRLFLSRSKKRVVDLQGFLNLRVSRVLEEEEMKEPMQRLETLWEMYVGVSEETDARQDQAKWS